MSMHKYFLWGAGNVGRRAVGYLKPLGILDGIIDSDETKWGQCIDGLEIYSYEMVKPALVAQGAGVIIGYFGSGETERVLAGDGVVYYKLADFIPQWFWKARRQHAVGFLDFPITTRCTLNCKECMQYIPEREGRDVSLVDLKQSLDVLFHCVSFVGEMSIIGGEPFLHKDIAGLMAYIQENYRGKIGSLVITTNGMVLPDAEVLDVCREVGVYISISDYSETLPHIGDSVVQLKKLTKNAGIQSEQKRWKWVSPGRFDADGGFFECSQRHMQLLDKKLWCCSLMAAAAAAGICEAQAGDDYYDLSLKCNKSFAQFLLNEDKMQRTSQCNYCLYPRAVAIPAAVQV